MHETIERGGKVRAAPHLLHSRQWEQTVWVFIPGSDSGLCPRKSSGTLHPVGDLLVASTFSRFSSTNFPTDFSFLHRERMNLKAPIYFSTGLTEKANHYYKLFITWTNQKIRKTFVQRNMFEFKHIKAFDRSYADNPGPMVTAAPPPPPKKGHPSAGGTVTARWFFSGGLRYAGDAACRTVPADLQEVGWK